MKHVIALLGAAALLAACAAGPEPVAAGPDTLCRVEPQTGSNLVRRERCGTATEEQREAARESARQAQEVQRMITPGTKF